MEAECGRAQEGETPKDQSLTGPHLQAPFLALCEDQEEFPPNSGRKGRR